MSVKLRKRKNSDGTISLYLDIYESGKRRYQFLNHLKLCKPTNPADRQSNKQNMLLAEKIAIKMAHDLTASDYSIVTDAGKKTMVTEWMQNYVNSYKKKDKRNMQGALNRFNSFLIEKNKKGLTFGQLSELIISEFQDYLREHGTGEGPSSYFNRFKKMVKQAYRQKLIQNNYAADVKTRQGNAKKKDVLTLEEIELLARAPIQNREVRRAFLFCLSTGIRWIQVVNLRWGNINVRSWTMTMRQTKTEKDLVINLNETAKKLLGDPGNEDQKVFHLPSSNGANKAVKAWVKRAGIHKKITWHNARHSVGTNLILSGADVTTTSKLLGHTSLKHTFRYVKIADELKERAIDKLNFEV